MAAETRTVSPETGFLPHEARFVIYSLERANAVLNTANLEYGEAVSQSGGDWAFDDLGAREAALSAHQKEQRVRRFNELHTILMAYGEIDYPAANSTVASYGSRVDLSIDDANGRKQKLVYDLGTHSIPDIPTETHVRAISPEATLGYTLIGVSEGEKVNWQGPRGNRFNGTVISVDQAAVKKYYDNLMTDR